jgi:hypothetical protein
MEQRRSDYAPPDPARIDAENPEALRKVGPMLEKVKLELGIGGV